MSHPYFQPMTGGEIVRNALRVYADHFRLLVLVTLVPQLALLLLETLALAADQPNAGALALLMLATVVMNGVALTALTLAIGRSLLGPEPGVLEVYGQAIHARLLAVVVAYLITSVLVSAGMVALIVPGIIIGSLFAPAIPMIVVERCGPVDGLSRSVSVMRGEWAKGAIVFSFFIAVAGFLPLLAWLLESSVAMGPFTPLLGAIVEAITLPLGFSANVLLYFSLRSTDAAAAQRLEAELKAPLPG
jgi:hypothetical protein